MIIGNPDGHFFLFPFSVISCSGPPSLIVPSFPLRSGIPPVILSERGESKDLRNDMIPFCPQAPKHKNRRFCSFDPSFDLPKHKIGLFCAFDFPPSCTVAEIYAIRQLKAGSAAQSKGCSACFVLICAISCLSCSLSP